MEILYVDIFVWSGLALAPEQKTFLGGHLFNGNILDGETKDDRPDHTERHLQVAIDNFLCTDGYQFHALVFDKLESFVYVGNLKWETEETAVNIRF